MISRNTTSLDDSPNLGTWFQTVQSHLDNIPWYKKNLGCPETSLSYDEEKKADDVMKELEKMLNDHDFEMNNGIENVSLQKLQSTTTTDEGISSAFFRVGYKENCGADDINLKSFSSIPSSGNQGPLFQGEGSDSWLTCVHPQKVTNFENHNSYERIGKKYVIAWYQYTTQICARRKIALKNWEKSKISSILVSWQNYARMKRLRYKELLFKFDLRVLKRNLCDWYGIVRLQREKTRTFHQYQMKIVAVSVWRKFLQKRKINNSLCLANYRLRLGNKVFKGWKKSLNESVKSRFEDRTYEEKEKNKRKLRVAAVLDHLNQDEQNSLPLPPVKSQCASNMVCNNSKHYDADEKNESSFDKLKLDTMKLKPFDQYAPNNISRSTRVRSRLDKIATNKDRKKIMITQKSCPEVV